MEKEREKVYTYTRVSTAMQIDGYSLDAQKTRMKAFADFNNYDIVGEYEDAGKSGKSIEGRFQFSQMMEDIKSGKDNVSYVLVFKLSRFGRNAADVLSTLQVMQDFGVNLICVEDGIDSSKDAGKLMISVLSAVAEIERENIRVQTMESDPRYFFGYARLRNSTTTGVIKGQADKSYNNGIYIDIFVLDGYIEDNKKYKKQMREKELLEKLLNAVNPQYSIEKTFKNKVKKCVCGLLKYFISERHLFDKYCTVLKIYNNSTERYTMLTHYWKIRENYYCMKSDLKNTIWMPFENITVPVPERYDNILSGIYGDYMQYPPVEKRGEWHNSIITFDPDIPYEQYINEIEKQKGC